MEITTRRRRALSTVLAFVLAIESVSAVAAVAVGTQPADAGTRQAPPAAVRGSGAIAAGAAAQADPASIAAPAAARVSPVRPPEVPDAAGQGPARTLQTPAQVRPARTQPVAVKAIKGPTKSSGGSSSGSTSTAFSGNRVYKGRNHVWIPALGINRSVSWFPCERSRPPDNYVYRWGCAGHNNVYLMGHAHSVFKSLHDAYVRGRLHKGMKAIYADAKGNVHTYAVRWWKLTRPTTAASWAWAGQSVPSMTLQTCVGKNSEYRLMVRLTQVD